MSDSEINGAIVDLMMREAGRYVGSGRNEAAQNVRDLFYQERFNPTKFSPVSSWSDAMLAVESVISLGLRLTLKLEKGHCSPRFICETMIKQLYDKVWLGLENGQ